MSFPGGALSITNPSNFKLEVLDIGMLYPTFKSVRKPFLIMNCMKRVLSRLNDNRLALNHSFIFMYNINVSYEISGVGVSNIYTCVICKKYYIIVDSLFIALFFVIFGKL